MAKPFLKWAGGKTQLVPYLINHIPEHYNKYIEPFLGGGSFFFQLKPKTAILSDSNAELINTYKSVRDNPKKLIKLLSKYENNEKEYYEIRELDPLQMDEIERAARLLYLNKTCYNGLYRVNKIGEFNVPYGKREGQKFFDPDLIFESSKLLQNAELQTGDYLIVLQCYAKNGDFVFLDPPYHPIGGYGDFNRYTKDFFVEDDHIELRNEFNRIVKLGCNVILTNSNTDFVNALYKGYEKEIIATKRLISCDAKTRTGEDVIYFWKNKSKIPNTVQELLVNFPGTRFMGSKYRILPFLWENIKNLKFNSALDAFSGSGCVSYLLKQRRIAVRSNDFMKFSWHLSRALIENQQTILLSNDIKFLLTKNKSRKEFIQTKFKDLYFSDEENEFLDNLISNIDLLEDPIKKSLALAAISRSCLKKRSRGIFTFVGYRYDDGRNDLKISLQEHFLDSIMAFNLAVFNNGRLNKSFNSDVYELEVKADLVYLDPPYLTPHSDNDYIRRYHFVEGLMTYWNGLEIQEHTKTKKFKSYSSIFSSKEKISTAFEKLIEKFKNSIIVLSYSSNSSPNKEELIKLLKNYKSKVDIFEENLTYSFGNQGKNIGNNTNRVKEYLFIAQ